MNSHLSAYKKKKENIFGHVSGDDVNELVSERKEWYSHFAEDRGRGDVGLCRDGRASSVLVMAAATDGSEHKALLSLVRNA